MSLCITLRNDDRGFVFTFQSVESMWRTLDHQCAMWSINQLSASYLRSPPRLVMRGPISVHTATENLSRRIAARIGKHLFADI